MAGGVAVGGNTHGYNSESSFLAFLCCLSASAGGALFGYDNGIMGGVVSMDGFLKKFFPGIAEQASTVVKGNLYCQYNSPTLQLMTSVLFLAGAICEVTGTTAYLSRYHGRKKVMMYSGIAFMIAAVLLASAEQISMIVIGRILQGIAISFASVSVPIYNSEMAPPHLRGRLNQLYQLVLTGAILVAQTINLIVNVTKATSWGWRLSLGFAFVPSFFLFLGGVFLPDSPNSLLERGFPEQARKNLELVRGTKDVDTEFAAISEAAELAKLCPHPWATLFSKKYRPQLVLAFTSTTFQQWTGINILIFYAPEIFLALGTTSTISLVSAIILGACNHLSTYISFFTADKFGRRPLFLQAGCQMFIALMVIGLSLKFIPSTSGTWLAWYILAMTCVFDMAYAWSYGPLAWLYPTEINPLETRSAGLAVASCANLLFSFVIAQSFLTMLCSFKWFTFIFFAICVFVMTVFVYFFYIEPKGVPIEECPFLFKDHWFWKRYATQSLGLQEKLVLQRKAQEAQERGESVPNIDGMEEALADKELYKKKEQIAHQHEYLMNNAGTEKANPKGTT